ncbi:MAG: porin [Polyangiaceae bacterium]|nr:porin [Polyangiaceae bacterium]
MDCTRGRLLPLAVSAGLLFSGLGLSSTAKAEKTLVKTDRYEIFTDGRAAGFLSWVYGDGKPRSHTVTGTNAAGEPAYATTWTIQGGEVQAMEERELSDDPLLAADGVEEQGTINSMRLRSGFIANSIGLGVRTPLTARTTATAYLQYWTVVESPARDKNNPNPPDLKQGYAQIEGPFGRFLAGRARCLFSRGATDINTKYAYAYAVGFPADFDGAGPTRGMVGFGVMGTGWASSLQYATPELAGLQLTVGIFDPIRNQAAGFNRTKYPRPEGELRYRLEFGRSGLVEPFVNGAYQKMYRDGYCDPDAPPNPDVDADPGLCNIQAFGAGYGARFEYGPVHLGVTGFFGEGLGLNRALEVSSASTDYSNHIRRFDGYYGQSQVVLGNFDVFAGAGIVRVFQTDFDKAQRIDDPFVVGVTVPAYSLIKDQIGINAGVVYHWADTVHFALDYFRAQFDWYLGEQQVIHAVNGGMTATW